MWVINIWNSLYPCRDVVCIRHPAYLVGEVLVVVREMCRTPAVYRFTDVLFGGDDNSENDELECGVAMVEFVNVVIV